MYNSNVSIRGFDFSHKLQRFQNLLFCKYPFCWARCDLLHINEYFSPRAKMDQCESGLVVRASFLSAWEPHTLKTLHLGVWLSFRIWKSHCSCIINLKKKPTLGPLGLPCTPPWILQVSLFLSMNRMQSFSLCCSWLNVAFLSKSQPFLALKMAACKLFERNLVIEDI